MVFGEEPPRLAILSRPKHNPSFMLLNRLHVDNVRTVGAAVYGNLLGVCNALINCPLHCICQVILHISSAPLLVASMQEAFAIACGPPEVHLHICYADTNNIPIRAVDEHATTVGQDTGPCHVVSW